MKVTPGYIEQDIMATELKIDAFHDRMIKELYDVIVEDASDLMKRTLGKDTL